MKNANYDYQALLKQAQYDDLTNIYNRRKIIEKIEESLKESFDQSCFIIADLDNFKSVNDTFGHKIGDECLIAFASILRNICWKKAFVGRLGGDEFIVFFKTLNKENVAKISNNIIKEVSSIIIPNSKVKLSCSLGIAYSSEIFNDFNSLYVVSDKCLKLAKKKGGAQFCIYEEEQHRNGLEIFADVKTSFNFSMHDTPELTKFRQEFLFNKQIKIKDLQNIILTAIDNDEFILYYQPKFSDQAHKIVSAEALVRWQSSIFGLVSPGYFIDFFNDIDILDSLDNFVLEQSLKTLAYWKDHKYKDVVLSINQNVNLICSQNYVANIKNLIEKYNINPHSIIIELSEHMVISSYRTLILTIEKLTNLGIGFSIDDFGSGSTTLKVFKKLPITEIKLDGLLLEASNEYEKQKSQILLKYLIKMANELKINVVAENIESKEQLSMLKLFGCNQYQGFIFDRPMPRPEFELKYLKNKK